MLAFVGGGISMVMLSRSVAADVNDRSQLDKLVQQFRIVTCVTLAIGVCAALLAPVGIVFLFGEAFAPSIVPGVLLCFAAVLLNANLVLHELTRGLGMPEIGMRAELCGLVGTILLLLLLLRPFGGLGAALTSIASYGGIMTSMLISISRRLDITIGSMLLPRADDVRLLIAAISRVGGRSRTSTAPVAPS
jgi:O-antigen/teichoic acid export membrane protein